jgi:tetratricopeptide (TPR) repeat protein
MQLRPTRRLLSYVANAILLLPLAGCASLQEPAPSLALASLRDKAGSVADAATLRIARIIRARSLLVYQQPDGHRMPARPSAVAYAPSLPAYPTSVSSAVTTSGVHLNVPNYSLVLSPQAIEAAYSYHADIAQTEGESATAMSALKKWLALDPANSAGWLRLAKLQVRLHDETAAVASLGLALRYDSANDAARLERAQLKQRLGLHAEALADFTAYLARHHGAVTVLRMQIDAARAGNDHVVALIAIDACIALAPDDVAMLRARGDELAARGDEPAAIAAWKTYVERRPADADVFKQIAYASEHTGDLPGAIWALNQYVRQRPADDRIKLALAYDQAGAGHPDLAVAAFTALEKSPDASVASQAAAELRARMVGAARGSREAYATVQYDSRFADTVVGVDTYALAPARRLQPYAVMHSWDDTRSSTHGSGAVVYNDNAEFLGSGVRYNLGSRPGKYFFAEAGEEVSLIGRGASQQIQYGFASWSESGTPGRGHTSYGFSIASYSRYGANVIGYTNVLHDFPLSSGLRGIVGTNFAIDTHRDYWNNVGELEIGIKVGSPRFSFTLAGVDGVYLPRGGVAPPKRFYTTFRPSITWSPHI